MARQLGLRPVLILRLPKEGRVACQDRTGNFLLHRIFGAEVSFVEYSDYVLNGSRYDSFLEAKAQQLRSQGERPYIIPEERSNALGCFGYISAVSEMLEAWRNSCPDTSAPDAIFTALGSGGTYAGLHLGLEAQGLSAKRLFAVNVCDDAEYFTNRIHGLFKDFAERFGWGARDTSVQICEGYVGEGYARTTPAELKFYTQVAKEKGLLLDPCYTGKAFRGMLEEIKKHPDRFGKHILFLHSGGGFGNFAYADQWVEVAMHS